MIIFQSLYWALPLYLANMAPVLMKWLPFLDIPVDAGKQFQGASIFGSHKTWRGLVFAPLFGLITIFVQRKLYEQGGFFYSNSLLDYTAQQALWLGFLMGLGAILGDLAKSFFKRRMGRLPGSSWPPFDQLDFLFGGTALSAFLFFPGWRVFVVLLIVTPILHLGVNVIAYHLKLKKVAW